MEIEKLKQIGIEALKKAFQVHEELETAGEGMVQKINLGKLP